MKLSFVCFLLLCFCSQSSPRGVDRTAKEAQDKIYGNIENMTPKQAQDREFFRYLLRVIKVLDQDKAWKDRTETLSNGEILDGKLTIGLYEELSAGTKERLDDVKKQELEFQENLIADQKTHMVEKILRNEWNPLHHEHKDSFNQKDIDLLLGRYQDLVDAKRREKFQKHEMEKELKHREELKNAKTEEERKELEEKEKEKESKHKKQQETMHEPVDDAQLKEVWEKSDGLDPDYFDLKTLFKLHDKNNDGFLDKWELETLFLNDIEKAYPEDDPDTDIMERDEEMERMREYAMNNIDKNGDGQLSLEEVVQVKASGEMDDEEEWHPLYGSREFTEDDLTAYQDEIAKEKIVEDGAPKSPVLPNSS